VTPPSPSIFSSKVIGYSRIDTSSASFAASYSSSVGGTYDPAAVSSKVLIPDSPLRLTSRPKLDVSPELSGSIDAVELSVEVEFELDVLLHDVELTVAQSESKSAVLLLDEVELEESVAFDCVDKRSLDSDSATAVLTATLGITTSSVNLMVSFTFLILSSIV